MISVVEAIARRVFGRGGAHHGQRPTSLEAGLGHRRLGSRAGVQDGLRLPILSGFRHRVGSADEERPVGVLIEVALRQEPRVRRVQLVREDDRKRGRRRCEKFRAVRQCEAARRRVGHDLDPHALVLAGFDCAKCQPTCRIFVI